jgi:hypothetical protein
MSWPTHSKLAGRTPAFDLTWSTDDAFLSSSAATQTARSRQRPRRRFVGRVVLARRPAVAGPETGLPRSEHAQFKQAEVAAWAGVNPIIGKSELDPALCE